MKSAVFAFILLFASLCSAAQEPSPSTTSEDATQQDISALRAEVAEQRKQIAEMRAMIERLVQQQASASSSAAVPVNVQTAAATTSAASVAPVADPKQVAALQATADRFRLSGDVRVRYDGTRQDLLQDRNRVMLRVRFGAEGKVGEDFTGGAYLATGSISDNPTSTNQTDSEFFTRRAIGLDRGWITYNPHQAKWMELTGGKFAYTWNRTSLTFDPDLNPEGFSERLTYKSNNNVFNSVTVTGLQLLFNEIAAPSSTNYSAPDSFAAGGQVSGNFSLGNRVSATISGLALNWRNIDVLAQAMGTRTLKANLNTNATVGTGATLRYASQFLYVDAMADTTVKTASERWPVRLLFDYVHNARARSDENNGLWAETALGRLQKAHDYQFGYSFARIEQDAVLAAFNESELRAPTNVLQHRAFFQWLLQKNTTAVVTGWFGRTLDRNLSNAAVPAGLPAGMQEPYVKKLQLDLIYKF